jgi:hypothetical protein
MLWRGIAGQQVFMKFCAESVRTQYLSIFCPFAASHIFDILDPGCILQYDSILFATEIGCLPVFAPSWLSRPQEVFFSAWIHSSHEQEGRGSN